MSNDIEKLLLTMGDIMTWGAKVQLKQEVESALKAVTKKDVYVIVEVV